jgi:hypothetical protein
MKDFKCYLYFFIFVLRFIHYSFLLEIQANFTLHPLFFGIKNEQSGFLPKQFGLKLNISNSTFSFDLLKNEKLFHPDYFIERWKSTNPETNKYERKTIHIDHNDCFYYGTSNSNILAISFCGYSLQGILSLKNDEQLFWITQTTNIETNEMKKRKILLYDVIFSISLKEIRKEELEMQMKDYFFQKRTTLLSTFQKRAPIMKNTKNINQENDEYSNGMNITHLWPKVLIVNDGYRFLQHGQATEKNSALLFHICNIIYNNSISIFNVSIQFVISSQITFYSETDATPWFVPKDNNRPVLNGVIGGFFLLFRWFCFVLWCFWFWFGFSFNCFLFLQTNNKEEELVLFKLLLIVGFGFRWNWAQFLLRKQMFQFY